MIVKLIVNVVYYAIVNLMRLTFQCLKPIVDWLIFCYGCLVVLDCVLELKLYFYVTIGRYNPVQPVNHL